MARPCIRLDLLLLVIAVTTICCQPQAGSNGSNSFEGPRLLVEPPDVVEFSNTTGSELECKASGKPSPKISWLFSDGSPLTSAGKIRYITQDGKLVFPPFQTKDFRQDVHAVSYKCAATNLVGTIVSKDVRVKAVIEQPYDVRVYDTYVMKGNPTLIKCHVPGYFTKYVKVVSWLRDDRYIINNTDFNADNKYVVIPDGDLYIRDAEDDDHGSGYKCTTIHRLTNQTRISPTGGKLFVTEPQANIPPRFIMTKNELVFSEGSSAIIPCVAQGYPVPNVSWYRKQQGILEPLPKNQYFGVLAINFVDKMDAGLYTCVANNSLGEERFELNIKILVPLKVVVNPKILVADVGASISFTCDVTGYPVGVVTWLKNGRPVTEADNIATSHQSLSIAMITSLHKGIYQCMARNDYSTAYDTTELKLGDNPPEIGTKFEEQTLHLGSPLSLTCSAVGSPTPRITWTIDGLPISQLSRDTQFESKISSWLNISNVRYQDGGTYTCSATNKAGTASHFAKINVFGPLNARRGIKMSGIAGQSIVLHCPIYGYPLQAIVWKKDGETLPANHRQNLLRHGSVEITNLQKNADRGLYECTTANDKGEPISSSLEITIQVPPKITPFFFQEDLVREGMRARLQCVVSEGDTPLSIRWSKDGHPLPYDSGIITRDLDEFSSILTISFVGPQHNGDYTCTASNAAGTSSHNAVLAVNDDQFFKGMRAHIICAVSQGDLPLHFLWLKDGHPIPLTLGVVTRDIDGHANSLSIESVSSDHTGNYTCKISNKAGTVSHTTQLLVYVAPKISPFFFQEANSVEGSFARVTCLVYQGDLPIQIHWLKDGMDFTPGDGVHIKRIDDYSSMLTLENVQNWDQGNYTCMVHNTAASTSHTAQLLVRVPPKIVPFAFQDEHLHEGMLVRVSCVVSRGDLPITISWLKDGHPIPTNLPVTIRDFDEYSSVLSVDPVTVSHNGNYTCLVTNHAGVARHTSRLLVNVPPHWQIKPQDQVATKDRSLTVDCQADGFPKPKIYWKKVSGITVGGKKETITESNDIQLFNNGSIHFKKIALQNEGFYYCYASNDVGADISKPIFIKVKAPVYFLQTHMNKASHIGKTVSLSCEAKGDYPITFKWMFNNATLIQSKDRYVITQNETGTESIKEQLTIKAVAKQDEGDYFCIAENDYGTASLLINVVVQEPPKALKLLDIKNVGSRSVEISWSPTSDKSIDKFIIEYKRKQDSWVSRSATLSVPATSYITQVQDLQPATVYEFRIAAENDVGLSEYSSVFNVSLGEEAPEGTPQQVEVEAVDPQTLRVSWKPPRKSSWNGAIRGYNVGYKVHETSYAYAFTTLEVPEDYTDDLIYQLSNLNMYTQYSIIVQAFNNGGVGPNSEEIIVMTSEDTPSQAPSDVRCSSLSSHSIYVVWESPPKNSIHGILRGYKVIYKPVEAWFDGPASHNVTINPKLTLTHLEVDSNYSIQVLAFTKLGDGVKSDYVFCKTYEDVPGAPAVVKALPFSAESVLVTWTSPSRSSSAISKYNVYYTPLAEGAELHDFSNKEFLEGVSMQTVDGDINYAEVKGLQFKTQFAFWVTAVSSIGEGPMSVVTLQTPALEEVPAQSASFDENFKSYWKHDLTMPCRAVGIPQPEREWFHGGRRVTLSEKVLIRFDGTLVVKRPTAVDAGNYTCRLSNKYGSDEVRYAVSVIVPPSRPIVDVLSKSLTSVRLRWKPPSDGGESIQGYYLHYKREGKRWERKELSADIQVYTLDNLSCGTNYDIYLEAFNNVGVGSPCPTFSVRTQGEVFQTPKKDLIIQEGSTFATLHLDAWPSTGCPILSFVVEYKQMAATEWTLVSNTIKSTQRKLVIPGLASATWYVLRVTAYTTGDDFNIGEFIFSTLTVTGGTIIPDVPRTDDKVVLFYLDPWIFIPVVGLIIVSIITSVVVFVYCKKHRPRRREPADWTAYTGTLAHARELGVSVESFVQLPKGGAAATLNRNGTMWRRGNDANPYSTIRSRAGCYSEMTLIRQPRLNGASRDMHQAAVHPVDGKWQVAANITVNNLASNPFITDHVCGNAIYGAVVAADGHNCGGVTHGNGQSIDINRGVNVQETSLNAVPQETKLVNGFQDNVQINGNIKIVGPGEVHSAQQSVGLQSDC